MDILHFLSLKAQYSHMKRQLIDYLPLIIIVSPVFSEMIRKFNFIRKMVFLLPYCMIPLYFTYQIISHRDQTGPEIICFHTTFLLLQGEKRRLFLMISPVIHYECTQWKSVPSNYLFPLESTLTNRQKTLQYPKAPHTYLTFHPSLVLAVHCIDTALDSYGQTCYHVFTMLSKKHFSDTVCFQYLHTSLQ